MQFRNATVWGQVMGRTFDLVLPFNYVVKEATNVFFLTNPRTIVDGILR